jgi:CheY-like chemotaxis protein
LREKEMEEILPRGDETILMVEDHDDVRKLAAQILEGQGYRILEASCGDDGLAISKEWKGPIHMILTDVVMPRMSGRELVERCKESRQDFKVLYMSGYTDHTIVDHGVLEQGTNLIQKPFTVEGLSRKVREVLD